MNTQYYRTKDFQNTSSRSLQAVYVGFVRDFDNVDVDKIIEMLDSHVISNTNIKITKSYVIFEIKTNHNFVMSKTKSLKNIRKAAGMGGIIFRKDFYADQHSTCTAQKIIIENNINEKLFDYDTFICVHNDKLTAEEVNNRLDVSLKLKNVDVKIDDLQTERKKEIVERLESIFLNRGVYTPSSN